MEKCPVIARARARAEEDGVLLHSIAGLRVYDGLFKKPKVSAPKAAKLPGFVISSTVAMNDPNHAPTHEEKKRGVCTGRKGYVRCLACNEEVYAPNARHHAAACPEAYPFCLIPPLQKHASDSS